MFRDVRLYLDDDIEESCLCQILIWMNFGGLRLVKMIAFYSVYTNKKYINLY